MFLRIFGSIPVVGSSYRGRGGGGGGERGKRIKGEYRWISAIANAFHANISVCKPKMSLM